MGIVALDTETCRFAPGLVAPELICMSESRNGSAKLYDKPAAIRRFRDLLLSDDVLVFHNSAYDLAVMAQADYTLLPLIFAALDADRVSDTMLREQMLSIAAGDFTQRRNMKGFSLQGAARNRLGVELIKDATRTSFGDMRGQPIETWPANYRDYAMADAVATEGVWHAQQQARHDPTWGDLLADEPNQTRAAFALQLTSAWGLRTHLPYVSEIEQKLLAEKAKVDKQLADMGLLRTGGTKKNPKLTKNMAALRDLIVTAYNDAPPLTEKGQVATSKTVLEESGDELLVSLAGSGRAAKFLSTYIPHLKLAATQPMTPGYQTLVETGRTSCREPNVQNLPRDGGLRECFVPRAGYSYVDVDYSTLELRTLSQAVIDLTGASVMADALWDEYRNGGADLHLRLAAQIGHTTVEDLLARKAAGDKEVGKLRNLAKAPNFGFPGGMGPDKFVLFAKQSYKLQLTVEEARELKAKWLATWHDMPRYFGIVSDIIGARSDAGTIGLPRGGLVRGGAWYTAACNFLFQGTAARGAKGALYETVKACFTKPDNPLYGSRACAFIHDEILLESPKHLAEATMPELQRIMVAEMQKYTPDVPIMTEGKIQDRWGK